MNTRQRSLTALRKEFPGKDVVRFEGGSKDGASIGIDGPSDPEVFRLVLFLLSAQGNKDFKAKFGGGVAQLNALFDVYLDKKKRAREREQRKVEALKEKRTGLQKKVTKKPEAGQKRK